MEFKVMLHKTAPEKIKTYTQTKMYQCPFQGRNGIHFCFKKATQGQGL